MSTKKGKAHGYTSTQVGGKNLTFEKAGLKASGRIKKVAVKTPDEMWYESKQPIIVPQTHHDSALLGQTNHQIPVFSAKNDSSRVETILAEQHQMSNDSNLNTSYTITRETRARYKKKYSVDGSRNLSSDMMYQEGKDSIIDESSNDLGQYR